MASYETEPLKNNVMISRRLDRSPGIVVGTKAPPAILNKQHNVMNGENSTIVSLKS